ncbi:hypothetical protein HKX42_01675 [Salinisphaera sp. USBA-960]|uniref:ankyrin repeat domain-containing protein n=1 Tax=Salinisphaera orenii TaxID=856731 RepID=UPI0013A64469|nr:hypothetical protein [Salifodinibacter halophilus]NNC25585.1 hypothetical protein [Salifodinibacter halophilus]
MSTIKRINPGAQSAHTPRFVLSCALVFVVGLVMWLTSVPSAFAEGDRDACQGAASPTDNGPPSVQSINSQGGLIYLFAHQQQILQPYDCARYYIAQGLSVDTRDPRPDHRPLTPLMYAIRQNDARLTKFLIQQGADLHKPSGRDQLKPMAYAYQLAVKYTSVDRNAVIGVLNNAITEQEQRNK